ncbi:MAG: IclR family transcriptional regulator [Victivallales bacterium]|nr:IclR family transcriptional regulator [Victivallales bacterium]
MNNKIPAVDKAVQLLLLLSEKEATQAELSAELGISMSTTYRILMTLQEHRWVVKKGGAVYSIGDGLLPLTRGLSHELSLMDRMSEKVKAISEEHQIACKLSVRKDDKQLTYFRAEPAGPVALTGQAGSTFPIIEGSVGAALLCDATDDEIAALVESCSDDIPENSNPQLLYDAIAEIRECGTALNVRKNRWNIAALSIPVRDATGKVIAALTVIGSTDDFTPINRKQWDYILKGIIEIDSQEKA